MEIKKFEQVSNNPYPGKILEILQKIGFVEKSGIMIGSSANRRSRGEIQFLMHDDGELLCQEANGNLLFTLNTKEKISSGGFLVLLQEFGIIHHRYIYERVDAIEEDFLEN